MMASKILVVGSLAGRFEQAFQKIATLHSKNHFSFAVVAGDLFGTGDEGVEDLLSGKLTIPLPTYFTVGANTLPQKIIEILERDEEICPDLHYLGKRSTTKTSEGVKIVTLGGLCDESQVGLSTDRFTPLHTPADAKALIGAHSADILLTTLWPASIAKGSKVLFPDGTAQPEGAQHVAELCASLKPRYHFASSPELYYEREPFFHQPTEKDPDIRPITRFYSIAAWGNPLKQKALCAFNLQPGVSAPTDLPANCTASPLIFETKRKRTHDDQFSRFSQSDDRHRHGKRGRRRSPVRRAPPRPDECFFCLSNPNLATHLVASIGDEAYLTSAKGPLTTKDTYAEAGLDFPCHMLIIPLSHSATLASIEEEESRNNTWKEMNKWKEAIQSMIAAKSGSKLGAVTYEISRRNGVHTHWQILPLSTNMIQKGLAEAAFRVEAENLSYPAFTVRDPELGVAEGDFFRAWIWSPSSDGEDTAGSTKCLTMALDEDMRFDLQFGRKVLAKLLGLEKRTQWRDCTQEEAEETADVEAFKTAFKEFDFSL